MNRIATLFCLMVPISIREPIANYLKRTEIKNPIVLKTSLKPEKKKGFIKRFRGTGPVEVLNDKFERN